MTNKEFLIQSYGYLQMKLFKYDGLYWFKASDQFLVAIEFLPPEYEPGQVVSLDKFEFIDGNIVATILDGDITIFNIVYTKHVKGF